MRNIFIFLFSSIFIFTSIFFLFSVKPNVPPDELFHFNLIEIFSKNSFFLQDKPDTYSLGPVSRTPHFYHFIMGKVLLFNQFIRINPYIFLRLFSLLMGIGFLFYSYKFLKELKSDWFTTVFAFLILSHTTMAMLLFGSISYDNPVNLLAIISFYLLVKLWRKLGWKQFAYWLIISLIGTLIKFTYLPLVVVQLTILVYIIFQRKIKLSIKEQSKKSFVLTSIILFLAILNFSFYGVNLIKYQSLTPSCRQVLTLNQCLKDSHYIRHQKLVDKNKNNLPKFSLLGIKDYYYTTYNTLFTSMYDLHTHDYIHVHKNISFFMPILVFLGYFLGIYYSKGRRLQLSLALMIFFYFNVLFFKLYFSYLGNGSYGIAMQGRYLFPVIVPLYYLIGYGFSKLLENKYLKVIFLTFIFILLNQITYRSAFHDMRLKPNSYGLQRKILDNINEYFFYKIPRIKIFEI